MPGIWPKQWEEGCAGMRERAERQSLKQGIRSLNLALFLLTSVRHPSEEWRRQLKCESEAQGEVWAGDIHHVVAGPFGSGQSCEDRKHPGFVPECPWGMFSPLPITFTVLLVVTVCLSYLD